jgi:prevent-host-death family protein
MTIEDTMKTAAVSELKASLSEYLGQVKAGEEVLITDRGKPIARIVPLGRDDSDRPLHLLELERSGLARIVIGVIPAEVRTLASRLLLNHPLRAADALQLAAALVWAGKAPTGQRFVCLEQRLRDAARKEGFVVVPEKTTVTRPR